MTEKPLSEMTSQEVIEAIKKIREQRERAHEERVMTRAIRDSEKSSSNTLTMKDMGSILDSIEDEE